MKRMSVWAVVIVAAGMMITSCNQGVTGGNASLKTATDSACYAFGVMYGANFADGLKTFPGGPANIDALIAGFITAIKEDTSSLKMRPEVAQAYTQQYMAGVQAKESETARAEGEVFLAANKTKEGVITTESGLQYKVLTEGSGQKPTAEDQVKVHYTGRLLDGTVFDSSVERGEPVTFALGGVIPGWTEALQIMPVGSKYQLWIPSNLAYGPQGNQAIRPNSTLEFEVELLEIVKPEKK